MQLQQRNYQVILSNNAASTTLVKAYLYLKLSNVFYDEVQLQELIHGAQNHWSNSKTDKKNNICTLATRWLIHKLFHQNVKIFR